MRVTQAVWEPALLQIQMGALPRRPHEGTTTAQIAVDNNTIWSH